jgi:hypothetical protein
MEQGDVMLLQRGYAALLEGTPGVLNVTWMVTSSCKMLDLGVSDNQKLTVDNRCSRKELKCGAYYGRAEYSVDATA